MHISAEVGKIELKIYKNDIKSMIRIWDARIIYLYTYGAFDTDYLIISYSKVQKHQKRAVKNIVIKKIFEICKTWK